MESRDGHLYQRIAINPGQLLHVESDRLFEFDVLTDQQYELRQTSRNGFLGTPHKTNSLAENVPLSSGEHIIIVIDGMAPRPTVTLTVIDQ